MTDYEIMREAMKLRNYSSPFLARKMGYSAPSSVTERMRGKNTMRCDTFEKIVAAMDCEIVVRSKLTDKTEWVLSFEQEDGEKR